MNRLESSIPVRQPERGSRAPFRYPGARQKSLTRQSDAGHGTGLDHRQARRLAVELPVIMQFTQGQRNYGQARNLSRDGVFIETGVRLNFDCCLDLVVPTGDAVGLDPIVLPALVIHRTNLGLGLMFRPLDGTAAASLQRLITEAQRRPAPSG